MPVVTAGQVVGLVSRESILRVVQTHAEVGLTGAFEGR
jgi:hypothetical protein